MNIGKTNKACKAQMDLFLETVIEMIIKGHSRTDILRHFANLEDETARRSETSIDLYIKKARLQIHKRFEPDREKLKVLALARLSDLYKKNYTIQDYRECRQVSESMAKLFGLNDAEKKETIGKIQYTLTIQEDAACEPIND